jgi:hypothetical protein
VRAGRFENNLKLTAVAEVKYPEGEARLCLVCRIGKRESLFKKVKLIILGLERGPLSLVSTTEE